MLTVYLTINCAVLALMIINSLDPDGKEPPLRKFLVWVAIALVPLIVLSVGAWQMATAVKEKKAAT